MVEPDGTPANDEVAEVWEPLAALVEQQRRGRRGFTVGVAGAVAVGKSTASTRLAAALRAAGASAEIVTTDGFLHPNKVLAARGIVERKGFPESYDEERLAAVLAAARAGLPTLSIPVYSHARYDVLDEPRSIDLPDVLVVEGVNALQPAFAHDLALYVDAEEEHVVQWYVDRFLTLAEAGRSDPTSFYARYAGLGDEQVVEVAHLVWHHINGPNLRNHILATRSRADVVIRKGPDHTIEDVITVSIR